MIGVAIPCTDASIGMPMDDSVAIWVHEAAAVSGGGDRSSGARHTLSCGSACSDMPWSAGTLELMAIRRVPTPFLRSVAAANAALIRANCALLPNDPARSFVRPAVLLEPAMSAQLTHYPLPRTAQPPAMHNKTDVSS